MRIHEILTESTRVDEGPIADKIGSTLGGIAGGVAGMGAAIKRGYQAGKAAATPTEPTAEPTPSEVPAKPEISTVSMKTIKASVAKLNKRQRAALRKLVAVRAGI